MAEITKPNPGAFCWVELNTSDPSAARKFYTELFGWGMEEMPTPMGGYAIAHIGGKHVGGIMKLPEQAKNMGAPPHWLTYVSVTNTDAATEKAKQLGGTLLAGPMDVGPGRLSVIKDPTDGVFAVWQVLGQQQNPWLFAEDRAFCWGELVTTNLESARKFYTQLFGWKAEDAPMPGMTYTLVKSPGAEQAQGGMMGQMPQMAGMPSMWTVYFAVSDADGTVTKATKLGAKVLNPPMDIPNVGRFAVLQDPQGAAFAIIKTMMP